MSQRASSFSRQPSRNQGRNTSRGASRGAASRGGVSRGQESYGPLSANSPDVQGVASQQMQYLTEEQKKLIIVEERYSFFQIENKLRMICQEALDSMKVRIQKESELMRKVQTIAEAAKRDAASLEPRIEKALAVHKQIDKINNDITGLEQTIKIETEQTKNNTEVLATSMSLLENKGSAQMQAFNAQMLQIDDCRRRVNIAIDQIDEFKEKLSAKVEKRIEEYRVHVAELERPQKMLLNQMDFLNKQMEQCKKENDATKIQSTVTQQKLEMAIKRIEELEKRKADQNDQFKLEADLDCHIKASRSEFDTYNKTLKDLANYTLNDAWKEARSITNRAITQVTRPLILKDLFLYNVGGAEHEVYKQPDPPSDFFRQSKPLTQGDAESRKNSIEGSVHSAKSPKLKQNATIAVFDYEFKAEEFTDRVENPVLGRTDVRNVHEINWEDVRYNHDKEWATVLQMHYEEICKIAQASSSKPGTIANSLSRQQTLKSRISRQRSVAKSSVRSGRGASPTPSNTFLDPVITLNPLHNNRSRRRKIKVIEDACSSYPGEGNDTSGSLKRSKLSKRSSRRRAKKSSKEDKDRSGMISVDDQSELPPELQKHSTSKTHEKEKKKKDKKKDKKKKKAIKQAQELNEDSMQNDSLSVPQNQEIADSRKSKSGLTKYSALGHGANTASMLQDIRIVSGVGEVLAHDALANALSAEVNTKLNIDPPAHRETFGKAVPPKPKKERKPFGATGQKTQEPQRTVSQALTPVDTSHQKGPTPSPSHSKGGAAAAGSTKSIQVSPTVARDHSGADHAAGIQRSATQVAGQHSSSHNRGSSYRPSGFAKTAQKPTKDLKDEKDSIQSSDAKGDDNDEEDRSSSSDSDDGSSSSGSESSEGSYEGDTDDEEQDTADGEALGIDFSRLTKQKEFEFYKEKIFARIEDLQEQIEEQSKTIQENVDAKEQQYSKGVDIIEERLNDHMKPVREDMEILLKTRVRQQSDDIIKQSKILEKFNNIQKEFNKISQTVDFTLCPIVNCLFESMCIQIAAEEQDDMDKMSVALYGKKEAILAKEPERDVTTASKISVGNSRHATTRPSVDRVTKGSTIRYPKPPHTAQVDSLQVNTMQSVNEDIGETKTSLGPASPGSKQGKATNVTFDQGLEFDRSLFSRGENLTTRRNDSPCRQLDSQMTDQASINGINLMEKSVFGNSVWMRRELAGVSLDFLGLDQKCLNCSNDQDYQSKLFKLACLAYTPNKVTYRKQSFFKEQLITMRKFLAGQTAQLIFQSQAMRTYNMCPKKVFDDVYLYIEQQALKDLNVNQEANEQWQLIDFEHDTAKTLRGILYKHRDLLTGSIVNHVELSLNSPDASAAEDYLTSAHAMRDKFRIDRQRLNSQGASTQHDLEEDFHTGHELLGGSQLPAAARDKPRTGSRKHSVEVSMSRNNRRHHLNLTTAPAGYQQNQLRKAVLPGIATDFEESPSFSTMHNASILKPNFFSIELPEKQDSIFQERRRTQQPAAAVFEKKRNIVNASDPMKMSQFTKQVFRPAGCAKEQRKQFMNYVNDTSKQNIVLRQKINAQFKSQAQDSALRKMTETPKAAFIAVLPDSDFNSKRGSSAIDYGNSTMQKAVGTSVMNRQTACDSGSQTARGSSQKKTLPPLKNLDEAIDSVGIRVKRTSELQLTNR